MRPTIPTHTLRVRILVLILDLAILRPCPRLMPTMPMPSRVAHPLIYPECLPSLRRLLRHRLVARRAIVRSPPRTAPPRLRTTPRESPDILAVFLCCVRTSLGASCSCRVVRRVSPRLVPRVRFPRFGDRPSAVPVHVSHHSPPSRFLRIKPPCPLLLYDSEPSPRVRLRLRLR